MSIVIALSIVGIIITVAVAIMLINKFSNLITILILSAFCILAGAGIGIGCYKSIEYSPKEVFVYDKVVVEIDKKDNIYDYYINYIYNDECYTTAISGKEFDTIQCNKTVDKFVLTENEWKTSKKRNDNASEKTSVTSEN